MSRRPPRPDAYDPGRPRPVWLGDPTLEPAPGEGCDVCAALVRQRADARARGDWAAATDCNVELRRHPHGRAHD
nr:hypothetical protein [Streptomyces kasugaensis]